MLDITTIILLSLLVLFSLVILFLNNKIKKLKRANLNDELKEVYNLYENLKNGYKKLEKQNASLSEQKQNLVQKVRDLEKANLELLERKEALQRSKEKVEDLHKKKEELFAIAIHDIKNPVSAIKGYLDLLDSYDLTAQEHQEIISGLLASSDKIVNLAQELSVAITANPETEFYEFTPTSLNDILHSVYLQNLTYAESKKIKLLNQSSTNLPKVNIDKDKIEEVIDNLVNNAIKYNHPETIVQIKSYFNAEKITIEVIDNGVGLEEEELKNVFKKGALLSTVPTGNETRSGLGLWIVKKIVEDHNGEVSVKSKKGSGSTFSFSLPIIK